ncbi:MAG TPA: branched-chain amino acid ABC transporter permease [Candidatus Tectomicrobia bacterium]|nr:branched-chain amino acid ABC transporter permease [Candidatus Tectomicrobia bacterium]
MTPAAGARGWLGGWLSPAMLVTFALFGALPLVIQRVGLYPYLGVEIMIWCVFALGFNILLGYTGLPSFGHGAYLGIGAYAMGLTQFHAVANLWACLLASTLAAAAVGGLVALCISHRRGIYFALMTIAFGQMFFFIASKWTSVTGGEDGLLDIRRLPADLGVVAFDLRSNTAMAYFAFATLVVVTVFLWRLVHSPFGKVLRGIKQNETRMAYLGYRVFLYKWASFTLSCAVAGLAGGLFAMAQNGAYVQIMSLQWSGVVVLMTLIGGGLVSFWGPVVGTVVYFVARDLLGAYTESWLLWFGLMFMLTVMFRPEGVAGIGQAVAARLGARRRARALAVPAPVGE